MLFLSIAHDYFLWHYRRAFGELFHVWLNFLWFTIHFFSIPQLLRSWFAPFKRITEPRRRGFNFEDIAGYVIINLMSRFVGFIIRGVILVVGFSVLLTLIITGALLHVLWVFVPLLLISGFVGSISLLLL